MTVEALMANEIVVEVPPINPIWREEYRLYKSEATAAGATVFWTTKPFIVRFGANESPQETETDIIVYEWENFHDDMAGAGDAGKDTSTHVCLMARFPDAEKAAAFKEVIASRQG